MNKAKQNISRETTMVTFRMRQKQLSRLRTLTDILLYGRRLDNEISQPPPQRDVLKS